MVLVKYKFKKKNGITVRKSNPFFVVTFYDKPIDLPTEIAEEIMKNPNFVEVKGEGTWHTKEELEKMGMKEVREIGDIYGVKDTKKSELIEEIIKKQDENSKSFGGS